MTSNIELQVQKAAVRAERVNKLVHNLEHKLSIFTESATGPNDPDVSGSWRTICQLEAESVSSTFPALILSHNFYRSELKRESYGVELLQTIGFVYVSKAKHHLATNQSFLGVGGWLHNVQGKYHVFSETYAIVIPSLSTSIIFFPIQRVDTPSSHRAKIGV